jgi:DNA repair protein RadC
LEGHRKRLRDRFLRAGIRGFTEKEALELLLTFALPRRDTGEPARSLLERFGSLDNTLRQSPDNLMTVQGLGPSGAVLLSLVYSLAAESLKPARGRIRITGPEVVRNYLTTHLGKQRRERFCAFLLDQDNLLLAEAELEFGTVDRATVHPRNLVEKVIAHNATGVILVHNHPGGRLEASPQDLTLTRSLARLGDELGFRVLDHFIATDAGVVSLREKGLV